MLCTYNTNTLTPTQYINQCSVYSVKFPRQWKFVSQPSLSFCYTQHFSCYISLLSYCLHELTSRTTRDTSGPHHLPFTFSHITSALWHKIWHILVISYVYWTVHHCDSWRIRDQLDVTSYYVLFHFFYAQHVSDINTSIIRSLQLFYCITTSVVCSCFDVPHRNSNAHRNKNTRPMWWYIEKSQTPDDGRINVRNMLSIEEVK